MVLDWKDLHVTLYTHVEPPAEHTHHLRSIHNQFHFKWQLARSKNSYFAEMSQLSFHYSSFEGLFPLEL